MFLLFINLYYSMFNGTWITLDETTITNNLKVSFNDLGKLLTSIFGDNQVTDFGTNIFTNGFNYPLLTISFILALITSIGIVVVATKGIKKLFTVFFYGVR